MKKGGLCQTAAALLVLLTMMVRPAHAYLGPGAGLGMIGSLIAVIVAVLVIFLGLVLYPIKVLRSKSRAKKS